MKVLENVNLGKAFESLKKTLIEVEKEVRKPNDNITLLDTGLKYAGAYGRLSAAVSCHIAGNTDTSYSFLSDALKEAENGASEAPTLYLHEQVNLPDDIPGELFTQNNGFGALAE